MDICRLCLESSDDLTAIFITKKIGNVDLRIPTLLALCTGLEISELDLMPAHICGKCSNDLEVAFSFRQRCWKSNTVLRQSMGFIIDKDEKIENEEIAGVDDTKTYSTHDLYVETKYSDDEDVVTSEKEYTSASDSSITDEDDDGSEYDPENSSEQCFKLKSKKKPPIKKTIKNTTKCICTVCKKEFKTSESLLEHSYIHTGEQPFKCELCDYRASSKLSISKHTRVHFPTIKSKEINTKIFECSKCNKTYSCLRGLKQHYDYKHKKPENQYKCELCDYRTGDRGSLTKHKVTHSDERPHICDICGFGCKLSGQLSVHRKIHSKEKHQCPTCLQCYPNKTYLQRHIKRHDPSRYVTCDICQKQFTKESFRRFHIKIHTGERPHVCRICNKGFIQRQSWRHHMETSHPNADNEIEMKGTELQT